ncbi:MAG: aminotransferase class IV, partial [Proteobacteria bacterium]|nr:aminotransferase class IV [Pseudomonadota bacterium]
MSRVVYVNGAYRPWSEAAIHAEDRGFQFADAIYEVIEISDGYLVDETRHLDRFERSRKALELPELMSRPALKRVIRETIRRNRVRQGSVYMQLSRGARPRDFLFPAEGTPPTFVCVARHGSRTKADTRAAKGIAIKTAPDIRWQRSDIKTVMLLPASLAKQSAKREGADDAWFVDNDGYVT